jgi:hypothetical protein
MSAGQLAAETVASVTKEALASPRLSPRNDERADDDFIEGDDLSILSLSRPGTPKAEPSGNVDANDAADSGTATTTQDRDPIPDAVVVEEKEEQEVSPSAVTEGPTLGAVDEVAGASVAPVDGSSPDPVVLGEEEKKEDVAVPPLAASEAPGSGKFNEELLKGKLEAALKRATVAEAEVARRSEEMAALQLDYEKLKLLEEKVCVCVFSLLCPLFLPPYTPHSPNPRSTWN